MITKDVIFAKLREVEDLINESTCDGEPLDSQGLVIHELYAHLRTLIDSVEYYLD